MSHQTSRTPRWRIIQADCLDALPKLQAESIDAVITDPPYGTGLPGIQWDRASKLASSDRQGPRRRRPPSECPNQAFQEFSRQWSHNCMHSLKPGAHLAVFAAPRTAHRLTCGLEEAGFEIRDMLIWLQGNGYPGTRALKGGLGTGLKPAWEPIILARKPTADTLDHNLAKHRTGALNIDACRVPLQPGERPSQGRSRDGRRVAANGSGRWPANLLLSHTPRCGESQCTPDCPVEALGERHRFFYCARAPRRERDAGCEQLPRRVVQTFKIGKCNEQQCEENPVANIHPTVKPIDLMRWIVRLLTPQGGLVLDPFLGSGSTGAAAVQEGARFIGIEREASYVPIARARIRHWACTRQPPLAHGVGATSRRRLASRGTRQRG